jgi:hypothetical protein
MAAMFRRCKLVVQASILLSATTAVAEAAERGSSAAGGRGPPVIDLQSLCRNNQAALNQALGPGTVDQFKSCIDSEQNAREALAKGWSSTSADDVTRCVQPAVYMPSYVEWLTCIDMQKDVRRMRGEQPALPRSPTTTNTQCPFVRWRGDGTIAEVTACMPNQRRVR